MLLRLIVLISVLSTHFVVAQDMDLYNRYVGDKEKMPDLYENITLDEYQILSRNVRMMDMMYATIVPGYMHFKANDKKRGYYILGARMAGFTGLTMNYIRLNNYDNSYKDMFSDPALKGDRILFYTSLSIIASSYLYDVIHGKHVLAKKQELIRYKYGIKLKMEKKLAFQDFHNVPMLSLTVNF